MEILAPAGNKKQLIASIDGGCDAVYGGVKYWNARNRAQNFTLTEYNWALDYCHKHKVKFYLTLNTLSRNHEIKDIIALLNDSQFKLPDAVIVTDIGLIRAIANTFPNLEMHASTQFGAHCADDIKMLHSLGVRRAILAREVTLKELKKIRHESPIELEVFIWGSQCIGFSGNCYWGGLTVGGSGNRGRCIGICRDVYRYKENIGQFFYSRDLEGIPCIQELKAIGINSVKIEGRMRNPIETYNIVKYCKQVVNDGLSVDNSESCYKGYLSSQTPVAGLIEKINSRKKYEQISKEEVASGDTIIVSDSFGKEEYAMPYKDLASDSLIFKYVKSTYTQAVSANAPNVALKILLDSEELVRKIDYINEWGERHFFEYPGDNTYVISWLPQELYKYIKERFFKYNIYDFEFSKPKSGVFLIDIDWLNEVLSKILTGAASLCNLKLVKNIVQSNPTDHSRQLLCLSVEIDSLDQLNALLTETNVKRIIFPVRSKKELIKVLDKHMDDNRIIYKLPLFDWASVGSEWATEMLKGQNLLVTRAAQLYSICSTEFRSVETDYTLPCWNDETHKWLKSFGVRRITGSIELSYEENIELAERNEQQLELIGAGNLPLVFSRHCWAETFQCRGKCSTLKNIENMDKQLPFFLNCSEPFYREVVASYPILAEMKDILRKSVSIRYIARFHSIKDMIATVQYLTANPAETAKLKSMDVWRYSYAGHIKESVR